MTRRCAESMARSRFGWVWHPWKQTVWNFNLLVHCDEGFVNDSALIFQMILKNELHTFLRFGVHWASVPAVALMRSKIGHMANLSDLEYNDCQI